MHIGVIRPRIRVRNEISRFLSSGPTSRSALGLSDLTPDSSSPGPGLLRAYFRSKRPTREVYKTRRLRAGRLKGARSICRHAGCRLPHLNSARRRRLCARPALAKHESRCGDRRNPEAKAEAQRQGGGPAGRSPRGKARRKCTGHCRGRVARGGGAAAHEANDVGGRAAHIGRGDAEGVANRPLPSRCCTVFSCCGRSCSPRCRRAAARSCYRLPRTSACSSAGLRTSHPWRRCRVPLLALD